MKSVERFSADGKSQAEHAIEALAVQVDPAEGGAWVVAPAEVQKMTPKGEVMKRVGMSGPTYEKAKKVVEAAENDPGLTEMVEEMGRTGKVDPAYRKVAGKSKKPQPKEADSATQALWLVEDALTEVGKLAKGTVRDSLTVKLKAIEHYLKDFFKL